MAHAQKPDLVFQRNRWVHLNRQGGGSVQSTTGSRDVRISGSNGSNAGYTMFWGRVQDYWLPTQLACFPFTSPTVRHRVLSGFNWALPFDAAKHRGRLKTVYHSISVNELAELKPFYVETWMQLIMVEHFEAFHSVLFHILDVSSITPTEYTTLIY